MGYIRRFDQQAGSELRSLRAKKLGAAKVLGQVHGRMKR